jgi:phage terminase small subunit
VRGGNRQAPTARPGAKVPRPPRALDDDQRRIWFELAKAVERLGTFQPSDLAAFRAMVRSVTRAELCPLDAPPSAAGRLEQAAASALASFGLSPLARERVKVEKDERSVAERILDLAQKGRRR